MTMTNERMWAILSNGGNDIFKRLSKANLTSDEVLEFGKQYNNTFLGNKKIWDSIKILNEKFENILYQGDDHYKFIPSLIIMVGKKGINDIVNDSNNILKYITSKKQIEDMVKGYETDDSHDMACVYAFTKIGEVGSPEVLDGINKGSRFSEEFDKLFDEKYEEFMCRV